MFPTAVALAIYREPPFAADAPELLPLFSAKDEGLLVTAKLMSPPLRPALLFVNAVTDTERVDVPVGPKKMAPPSTPALQDVKEHFENVP